MSDTASLFSHIKTWIITDQTFHHVRRWEWTDTTENVLTPSFFFFSFPPSRREFPGSMYKCTTCDVALLREQLSVFSVTQRTGRDGGRDGAHAFLFFNFVVKVSYFVQLQSWSLKERNHGVKRTKHPLKKTLRCTFLSGNVFFLHFITTNKSIKMLITESVPYKYVCVHCATLQHHNASFHSMLCSFIKKLQPLQFCYSD